MKKKFLSAILIIAMMLTTILPVTTFASSNPSSWAVEEVSKAKNEGLVTDSVMMDYRANITREQFCEMVVRAYEKISGENAEVGNVYFSDTSNVEILKAANLGIVTGYGNNVFGPNDLITREQIAAMLVRMIDKSVFYANINVYNDNYFNDKNNISDWAISSVNFAYDKGIMQGVGNNCIDPQANTTCEQAVLLVYRTVDKYYNAEAQLDSIYELTEEHIAQDEETFVHYTDNIILAFIERGLSEEEKEEIADVIDGDVVAQLAGSINLLQIEVESSDLHDLEKLAEQLNETNKVYYASPDILISKNMLNNITNENHETTFAGEDEWWIDAIEADYVWNKYEYLTQNSTVGVIEVSGVLSEHQELHNKIVFTSDIQKQHNELQAKEHGTNVCGIIAAERDYRTDEEDVTGVSYKSNILFSTLGIIDENLVKENATEIELSFGDDYLSCVNINQLIKNQIDCGANAINCSFGFYFYNESYFNTEKAKVEAVEKYDDWADYMKYKDLIFNRAQLSPEEFYEYKTDDFLQYTTYEEYITARNIDMEKSSQIAAVGICQAMEVRNDFLIVQGAGNGENNEWQKGIDARKSGFVAGITEENCSQILKVFNVDFKQLQNHILVVSSVENDINDGNYIMACGANYGETVGICAPGVELKVCSSESSKYSEPSECGTSLSAPMVTGTAAVLWGIDKTLTAAEVKDFILKGSKCKAIGVAGEDAGREYPMLNVRGAVEELLKTKAVHISVGDKDTNGRIQDATVSYVNGLSETTDIIGSCDIYLVDKNHEITISKEGYKTVTVTVEDKYIGQEANPDIIWLEEKEILLEKEESPQQTFNGHTYQFIDEKMTWENAKKYCENQGGYLATITSAEENAFISSLSKNGESFWIGATHDNSFKWVTGEKVLFTDTLEYGEPSRAAKYIVSDDNGNWTNLIDRELCFVCEWGDYSLSSTELSKFNTVAEYNGKVYSGIEGGDAIHVGEPGETTKFCIIDDYIYYYHTHIGYVFGENYHNDFLQIWRTDLNGNNKISVGHFEGNAYWDSTDTLTSEPYIVDNKIYLSINQYDYDSGNDVGWMTWTHDMNNATLNDYGYETVYLTGNIGALATPHNAKYIIDANNDYIFYQPYDPMQYEPPFATGFVVYDIQNNKFSTINTNSAVINIFSDDKNVYYTTDNGMEQATYRYNLDNGENVKIADFCIHYLSNNVGYYTSKIGGINSINLSTLEITTLFIGYEYGSIILETENYLYITKSESSFYGQIYVQYNKQTGEEKIIAKYEYPN